MTKQKEDSIDMWLWVVAGMLFVFLGAHKIITGEPDLRGGVETPAWTGWVQLPFGLWIVYLSIRAIWRNRKTPEPPVNIDMDAPHADAKQDTMPLQEQGKLSEKNQNDG